MLLSVSRTFATNRSNLSELLESFSFLACNESLFLLLSVAILDTTSSILVSIFDDEDVFLRGFKDESITYIVQLSHPKAKEPLEFFISFKIFYLMNSLVV